MRSKKTAVSVAIILLTVVAGSAFATIDMFGRDLAGQKRSSGSSSMGAIALPGAAGGVQAPSPVSGLTVSVQ